MRYFISTICLLCIPALCLGEPIKFVDALKSGDEFDAKFTWDSANNGFSLSAAGILSPTSQATDIKLKLPLDKYEYIERLLVQRQDNDLLLAIEATDSESGRGYICRIRWPQNTVVWCQKIPGFNIHVSASMGSIYIGAIGFFGRLNPKNGKYIWKHGGLYESDDTLNIVCLSAENDTNVIFNATSGIKGKAAKQIRLDRNTGKIIQKSDIGIVNVCN